MPKKVDHQKRKVLIAEATWEVIVNDGIEKATVRKIAETAGLSVGALRHYFSTQSELLRFSMELVSERVKRRISSKKYSGNPMELITDAVCEVLPVDEERRVEMEVWFVFSAKSLVDAALRKLGSTVYNEMHEGFGNAVRALQSFNFARDDLDVEMEVCRLHAIVDGMAMHHLLYPEQFTYDQMIQTLTYHLQSLCKPFSKGA